MISHDMHTPALQHHGSYSRCHTAGSQCCSRIQIGGADKQKAIEGVYVLMAVAQNGRSVYQQSDGANYIYYWPAFKAWRVGLDYTKPDASIASTSGPVCPDLVTTTWYELDGAQWTKRQLLQVNCEGAQHVPHHYIYIYIYICMCVCISMPSIV